MRPGNPYVQAPERKPFPDETSTAGWGDIGGRHDDAARGIALHLRAGFAIRRRQMPRQLGQAGELERGQVFAAQVLREAAAIAGEIRTDEEVLLLKADPRLGDA